MCEEVVSLYEQTSAHCSDPPPPTCAGITVCTYSATERHTEAHAYASRSYLQMVKEGNDELT